MIEGKTWDYTREPTVVIGGRGELGTRMADGLKRGLKIAQLTTCDIGDPIREVLTRSRIAFFATEEMVTKDILESCKPEITPGFVIVEGASTKQQLIPLFEEFDKNGISVASVHLGIKTDNSWAGAKLWNCEVGSNSGNALLLAQDLFSHFRTRIVPIKLRDHHKIQETQVHTFVKQLAAAISLMDRDITFQELDQNSTANSQLGGDSDIRGLGQRAGTIGEILNGQLPTTERIIDSQIQALQLLKSLVSNRKELEDFIDRLQNFHGGSTGKLQEMFNNTGLLIAQILRTSLCSQNLSIPSDTPGTLRRLLNPFDRSKVSLTAIGSMRVPPTKEAIQQGMDARAETVVFQLGIDPETTTPETELKINQKLRKMGAQLIDN